MAWKHEGGNDGKRTKNLNFDLRVHFEANLAKYPPVISNIKATDLRSCTTGCHWELIDGKVTIAVNSCTGVTCSLQDADAVQIDAWYCDIFGYDQYKLPIHGALHGD